MTYSPQSDWGDIADSLGECVDATTQNEAVVSIIVVLLVLLAAVVLFRRFVHG